ncbi:hypothetical protein PAHAL_1G295600 [Panicum hallii]|uniref:Uncharacterized protein n=1 Tax=Panicum hallii TaxID=206008 RepID=A0A2T8KWP2_9POAL|nr:hypothetical protein PAHAL_1G295600 [Panicum hallii]
MPRSLPRSFNTTHTKDIRPESRPSAPFAEMGTNQTSSLKSEGGRGGGNQRLEAAETGLGDATAPRDGWPRTPCAATGTLY